MDHPLILGYHAVSARWPSTLAVTPHALERQLELVVRRGFRGVTLTDLVSGQHDDRVVVVTFDDAYRSVLDLALPILERLGLPGTVYVPTGHVDRGPMSWPGIDQWIDTEHERELIGCTWDELGVLAAAGWEIGSHTCTHPRLSTVSDEVLADELRRSRLECERRLGVRCLTLAFPYGDGSSRVAAAAGAAGYVATVGGPPRAKRPPHPARTDIYRKDAPWRFALKVTPMIRGSLGRFATARARRPSAPATGEDTQMPSP